MNKVLNEMLGLLQGSLSMEGNQVKVVDAAKFRANVEKLVERSALAADASAGWARFLIRSTAQELGIIPASIQDLYLARGRGEVPMTFTTPAFNLRALSYHAARAMFRAAMKINAGAFIFEIARSEIGYTAQRPSEYASNILAAAIVEGFSGPVFIQGDHFQVSAKNYSASPEVEINSVKELTLEAIAAGFFNIDVDTSTLVDISKATVPEQQILNYQLSAQMTAFIREHEPQGVAISIGGEIGEVGGHNSTKEELRAYMDGFNREVKNLTSKKNA